MKVRYGLLSTTAIFAAAVSIAVALDTPSLAGVPSTQLRVVKRLVPVEDPGRFNLEISGITAAENVGDGGDTGPIEVEPGAVEVAELPVGGTVLSDYLTAIECVADAGAGPTLDVVPTAAGEWAVQVREGESALCTITNERAAVPPPATVSLSLSHRQLRFGTPGERQALEVTNPSATEVAIRRLELRGPDRDGFEVVAEDCAGRELASNEACRVVIAFSPTTAGTLRAELVIVSDAEGSQGVVALTGRAATNEVGGESESDDGGGGGGRGPDGGGRGGDSGGDGSGPGLGPAPGGPQPAQSPGIAPPPASGAPGSPSAPRSSSPPRPDGRRAPGSARDGSNGAEVPGPGQAAERSPIPGVPTLASLVDDGDAIPTPGGRGDARDERSSAPPFSFAPEHLMSSGAGYLVLLLLLAMFPLTSVLGRPADRAEGDGGQVQPRRVGQ